MNGEGGGGGGGGGHDEALTGRLTADLLAGGGRELARHFAAIGAPVPVVRWTPEAESLAAPQLRVLLDYWEGLPRGPAAPLAARVDALHMRGALGFVMLMQAVDGGRDFRYRVYGSGIAAHSGFDATGKRVTEIAVAPLTEFFLAGYRAVRARPVPLFTRHVPPYRIHPVSWDRLILPLDDGTGEIARLLVGNVPGDWAG